MRMVFVIILLALTAATASAKGIAEEVRDGLNAMKTHGNCEKEALYNPEKGLRARLAACDRKLHEDMKNAFGM